VRWELFGEMNEAVGKLALENKNWQWVGQHFAEFIKKMIPISILLAVMIPGLIHVLLSIQTSHLLKSKKEAEYQIHSI
jgi:hypothetical protein